MPDAPAAAPTAPTPDPALAVEPPKGYEEAFGAIDALGREEGTPEPAATPPPGDGRVRGPDGKFVPKDKVPDKPAAPKAEPPKPDEDIDPTKLKTSELAKHYHKLKAEQKEWIKAKEEYEKKLKTPPEWPEKKTYEEQLADREKKIEEYNKRVSEYETKLRFTNYRESQEFQDKYQKPYEKTWKLGEARTAELQIVERTDEAGNVIQKGRDATAEDFHAIMRIGDNRSAVKRAVELFGDGASIVLNYREKANELASESLLAIDEFKAKGAEWEKQQREQSEKQSKEYTSMVDKFQKAAIEKYPHFFKPDPSDPKANGYLESGSHLLERVLKNGAPISNGEKPMTSEEFAIAVAAVRNKAMGFDRVAYLATTRAKRIKELEKELEQFKSSKPGNGDGNGRTAAVEDDDPLAKLDKLGRNV
jgi:hypothetical protein